MYVSRLPFKGKDVMESPVRSQGGGHKGNTGRIQDTDSWAGTSAVIGTCQKFSEETRH